MTTNAEEIIGAMFADESTDSLVDGQRTPLDAWTLSAPFLFARRELHSSLLGEGLLGALAARDSRETLH